jgi:hypothetical protein
VCLDERILCADGILKGDESKFGFKGRTQWMNELWCKMSVQLYK